MSSFPCTLGQVLGAGRADDLDIQVDCSHLLSSDLEVSSEIVHLHFLEDLVVVVSLVGEEGCDGISDMVMAADPNSLGLLASESMESGIHPAGIVISV